MNNPYHYYLNLPVEFSTEFVDKENLRHAAIDVELINPAFRQWLSEKDLVITRFCERFVLDPVRAPMLPIHIDNPDSENHVKINYVFCDSPHTTVWYKLKPGKELKFAETFINTRYAWADIDDCEPLYSATIGQPSLFNATILHGVPNVTSERITYSMTLSRISTGKFLSWKEAEEIFKDYICEKP